MARLRLMARNKKKNNRSPTSDDAEDESSPRRQRGKKNRPEIKEAKGKGSNANRRSPRILASEKRARKSANSLAEHLAEKKKGLDGKKSSTENAERKKRKVKRHDGDSTSPSRRKRSSKKKKNQSKKRSSSAESPASSESDSSSSSSYSESSESEDSEGNGSDGQGSSCSSSSSSDTLIDKPPKKISKHYIKKLAKHFHSLDDKMKKASYKSVERHLVFSSLSRKVKNSIAKERKCVKPKPSRERRSWEYMYNCWLTYAACNPDRKNQVPIAQAKLSTWVHEQRKKFVATALSQERFTLLSRAGFDFQPRKSAAQSMRALVSAVGKFLHGTNVTK